MEICSIVYGADIKRWDERIAACAFWRGEEEVDFVIGWPEIGTASCVIYVA